MAKIGRNPDTVIGMLAVLLVGILCQSSGAENPALAYMAQDFSDLPYSTIAMVTTLPSLMMIPASLAYSALRRFFGFRTLFVGGSALLIVGGVAPAWATSFEQVLAWRAVFGLGVGVTWPLAQSMIVELYEGNRQDTLLGWNSVVTAFGGIIWSNVGGLLALHGWRAAFFTYFIPVAILVFCGIFLPSSGPAKKRETHDKPSVGRHDDASGALRDAGNRDGATIPTSAGSAPGAERPGGIAARGGKGIFGLTIIILVGYFLYNFCNMVYFTNISMKVVGEALGDSASAGFASSFYTVGSLIIGVVFGRAMRNRWFARYSMAVGWIASAVGMLIVGTAGTFPMVVVGSVVQGFGTGTFMPTMVGIIGNVAGKQNASLVLGISMCLVGASQFFGPTIFNVIVEALGLAAGGPCITLAAVCQLCFALAGTIVLVLVRRGQRLSEE